MKQIDLMKFTELTNDELCNICGEGFWERLGYEAASCVLKIEELLEKHPGLIQQSPLR